VVIACPKCKTKLKVPDEKLKPEGIKIKCPKCSMHLKIKGKAPAKEEAKADKAVVTHANPDVLDKLKSVLGEEGYVVDTAPDGVDVMIRAMKQKPAFLVIDIAAPKIHGFAIAQRLKTKNETKGIKIILVSSKTDSRRKSKMPPEKYGVDAYVDDDAVDGLPELIRSLTEKKPEPSAEPKPEPSAEPKPEPSAEPKPEPSAEPEKTPAPEIAAPPKMPAAPIDDSVDRARRLARLIFSDIELYSPQKVTDTVRDNTFPEVFKEDLREGLKHYNRRIPPEVRGQGDFYKEELHKFIENKKKTMGL
jgi:predicted Zn finger-like uncharacterized protein